MAYTSYAKSAPTTSLYSPTGLMTTAKKSPTVSVGVPKVLDPLSGLPVPSAVLPPEVVQAKNPLADKPNWKTGGRLTSPGAGNTLFGGTGGLMTPTFIIGGLIVVGLIVSMRRKK